MRVHINQNQNALWLLLFFIILACSEEDDTTKDPVTDVQISTTLNPSGLAPLSALLSIQTVENVRVRIRILGQDGPISNIEKEFPDFDNTFSLPVLGLYADFNNTLEVELLNSSGFVIETQNVSIQTQPLSSDLPDIEINSAVRSEMTPGFNLVNYFGHNSEPFPQEAFMFDSFGKIRWYVDFTGVPNLDNLFFDNGLNRLRNGNFIFGDIRSNRLYEIDMLGNIVNTYGLGGFGFHHHVIEKPNGNFLVTVNDPSKSTIEDVIIEIDRNAEIVLNTWDLTQSLDPLRRVWETDLADLDVDWFHANGLSYNEIDNTIIVSGRTQGTVKLNEANEVVWILAPHRDWSVAGNGLNLNQFLLEPLDAQGNPINDSQVLLGWNNLDDFQWAWYQHSPVLLPNGNLMLFDNGENRNYSGTGTYSRAVEYRIDDTNKTIQQVWDYGEENGLANYSRIVSKVEYHSATDHVLFTPGAVQNAGTIYGKVIELDHETSDVIFEATIYAPQAFFGITFHNAQRMPIYAE